MRCAPLLIALATCLPAGEAPVTALGAGDVEMLDERAWVESVSRRRQDVASAPAPVEVILVEDILRSPAATVPDRLRYVPGVDVYQLRHGQYEVGLRGYNDGPFNSRILVLQDGWQFRQPEAGVPLWSGSIDYSDLERIEVAKGPASVTYGENAFGGVISLTSKPVPDEVRFSVVGRAGRPAAGDADATLAGPISARWYGKLGAGFTILEDLPEAETSLVYVPGPRHDEDTQLDTSAWRARAMLGVRLEGDWVLEGSLRTVRRDPWEVVDGNSYGPPNIQVADDLAVLELRSSWLRLTVAQRRLESDYLNLKAIYDPTIDFTYLQFGFEDSESTARLQIDIAAGSHHLGFGGEAARYTSSSNLWKWGVRYQDRDQYETAERVTGALFIEDQWQISDQLLATAGVRGDNDSRTGAQTSPRVALNWTPEPRQFVLLSYSRGYRQPTNIEAFEDDWYTKPNEELDVETIQAVEAQWRLRDGRDFDVGFGAFWNRSNDSIWVLPLPGEEQVANFMRWVGLGLPGDVGPGPAFQYANLDNPYTVLGAEAHVRSAIADTGLTAWANSTWQHGRYRDEIHFSSDGIVLPPPTGAIYRYDFTVPRDANAPPEWKANAGLDWAGDGWFASLAGRYVSGKTVFDMGHSQFYRNTVIALDELDPYLAMDVALGRTFGSGSRYVRLSIMDVFDSAHAEWYQPTAESLAGTYETQYAADIGRQISLSAGWQF